MPEYLVFRLYGPMASWGGIAVGEYRPGEKSPTKSAILGLIGAALGIRRDDAVAQARLRDSYRMATIAHAPGTLLRDYHTTQVAPEIARKRNWKFATRRRNSASRGRRSKPFSRHVNTSAMPSTRSVCGGQRPNLPIR